MKETILNRKILFVDDSVEYRASLIPLFPKFEFLQASTIREAMEVLKKNRDVYVILLDLQLGEESGTLLLEAIKAQIDKYRVIVLTAHESLLDASTAERYGVYSYVAKTKGHEVLTFHLNDAFTAVENAWLQRKVDAHLEILRKVNQLGVGPKAEADRELREALDLICERAVELLGAYTCHVRLLDPARGDFELWASRDRNGQAEKFFEKRVPPKQAYSALAADTRARINIAYLQEDEDFNLKKTKDFSNPDIDPEYRDYLNTVRSACIDPISTDIFGPDIDAVFNINSDETSFFSTPARLGLVDDFVSQTNLAVTKYRWKKKRRDLHDDYRNIGDMLEEISKVFIAGEDQLETIYRIVFNRIAKGLGAELISIFLYDEKSQCLKNVAEYRGHEWIGPTDEQFSPGQAIVGRVYLSGTKHFEVPRDQKTGEIVTTDLPDGYEEENIEDKLPSMYLKHYLAAPIKFNNVTLGVIRVANKTAEQYHQEPDETKSLCLLQRGFSEDCVTELEITGNHLGATIKNTELIGELSRKVNQIKYIYKVGEAIGFGQDMDAAFNLVVKSAAEVLKAEICMLFQMNEKGDRIELTQISGMPFIEGAHYVVGEGKTGGVAKSKRYILESKAKDHIGKYHHEIVSYLREKHGSDQKGIESFMAFPLKARGQVLGVIKLINKVEPPFEFQQEDVELFEMFDSQMGLERFLYTQRYLKNIVDNSPVPIIFLKRKGIVEIFNKACEQLWGRKREDVINKSVIDLYISEQQAIDIGNRLRNDPEHRVDNVNAQIKDSNGKPIDVLLSATFIFDGKNRIGSMGVFKDQREIRRFVDQLERSEREAVVGKLATQVGHDIKTSVGTALNYIDALLFEPDPSGDEELQNIYRDMQVALEEAIAQLKNMLAAVLPEPLKREKVRVKDIFANKIDNKMYRQANRRRVDFVFNCENEEQIVFVDINHLHRMLWNFFDNSLDAIEKRAEDGLLVEPGRIECSVRVRGDNLELVWTDNGCGISAAAHEKIFLPDFTTKENGTGLGLFSVKNSVQNHEGRVEIDSVEGQGSTFTVTIPMPRD